MYGHLMDDLKKILAIGIVLIGICLLICIYTICSGKNWKTYPIIINGSSYRVEKNVLNYIHKIEKETNKELERKA